MVDGASGNAVVVAVVGRGVVWGVVMPVVVAVVGNGVVVGDVVCPPMT